MMLQDILCKIKAHLVDEKKPIRMHDWNAAEVFLYKSGVYLR